MNGLNVVPLTENMIGSVGGDANFYNKSVWSQPKNLDLAE